MDRRRLPWLAVALVVLSACQPGPVVQPTASPSSTPAGSPTPSPTPSGFVLRQRVYFARDQLPPVGVDIDTTSATQIPATEGGPLMAAARAKARLQALATATAPSGLFNMVPSLRTKPSVRDVKVDGDLITVDYDVPGGDWGSAGTAGTLALIQQLMYTASEEPGIRRVLITENGGKPTIIDQVQIDKPTTRDDVVGYLAYGTKPGGAIEYPGDHDLLLDVVDWRASAEDVAPGLGRFVVELRPQGNAPDGFWSPEFKATLVPNTAATPSDVHKWTLRVEIPDAVWPATPGEAFHCCPFKAIDKTPIRTISAYPLNGHGERRGVGFGIGLDDARPWRVTMLQSPMRMVVDIGGHPQAVGDSITVYAPKPVDEVGSTFTVTGLARTFEANVQWRLKVRSQVVAQGHTTASVGTSAVWGGYAFTVRAPAGTAGNVDVEVFWGSPKDGSDQGLVSIPLRVR